MAPTDQNSETLQSWRSGHYNQLIVVRWLLAPWILFVTIFLCVKGYWWGLVFLPFLALDIWLLRNLRRDRANANANRR
jgi:uncharacterized membrane protein